MFLKSTKQCFWLTIIFEQLQKIFSCEKQQNQYKHMFFLTKLYFYRIVFTIYDIYSYFHAITSLNWLTRYFNR